MSVNSTNQVTILDDQVPLTNGENRVGTDIKRLDGFSELRGAVFASNTLNVRIQEAVDRNDLGTANGLTTTIPIPAAGYTTLTPLRIDSRWFRIDLVDTAGVNHTTLRAFVWAIQRT